MFFKKKKEIKVLAPMDGQLIELEQVSDPVFSGKVLGDGAAVIPTSGMVVSPVAGIIKAIADTFHAIGIQADSGLELLLHIGINTVEMNGSCFDCKVQMGDKVQAGDLLCEVDLEEIKKAGYDSCTPILITNMDAVKNLTIHTGDCIVGETCIIEIEKN